MGRLGWNRLCPEGVLPPRCVAIQRIACSLGPGGGRSSRRPASAPPCAYPELPFPLLSHRSNMMRGAPWQLYGVPAEARASVRPCVPRRAHVRAACGEERGRQHPGHVCVARERRRLRVAKPAGDVRGGWRRDAADMASSQGPCPVGAEMEALGRFGKRVLRPRPSSPRVFAGRRFVGQLWMPSCALSRSSFATFGLVLGQVFGTISGVSFKPKPGVKKCANWAGFGRQFWDPKMVPKLATRIRQIRRILDPRFWPNSGPKNGDKLSRKS